MPKSKIEWRQVATDYNNLWNFKNYLGAMDGKHIRITKPPKSHTTTIINYTKPLIQYYFIWDCKRQLRI